MNYIQRRIEKYLCVHCPKRATRRRKRRGTKLYVTLCDSMRCLRKEWRAEDAATGS
jgi:hypothetical protein